MLCEQTDVEELTRFLIEQREMVREKLLLLRKLIHKYCTDEVVTQILLDYYKETQGVEYIV